MSTKANEFCDQLRDRINALEEKVSKLKTNVQNLPQQGEDALKKCLTETRGRIEEQKRKVDKARANLKIRAEQKVDQFKEAVSQWKAQREVGNLKARAEWTEQYAADAVLMASMAVAEAEEAILDAAIARMDADNAEIPTGAAR